MKKTIKNFELKGKRVIIRVDFNVPLQDGVITDDSRIVKSLPTIRYAQEQGAKIILLSHLGRIKKEEDLAKYSLQEVASHLANLLNQTVYFSNQTRGKELEDAVQNLKEGEILLVQNTRYEDLDGKKESSNDQELASYWAKLGEIFINDAFATAHRSHASNVGIASILPSGIGLLMEKELTFLSSLQNPEHPFYVILGGSKVSDKIGVIQNLISKVDGLFIGGGMAFTFLKAKNISVGSSLVEDDFLPFCQNLLATYPEKILLPVDVHASCQMTQEGESRIIPIADIKDEEAAYDIGSQSISLYKEKLRDAATIFWNGPLGVYEIPKYQTATKELLDFITSQGKKVILGGGDIASAAVNLGYEEKVTYISTGGGATLEYLEGKELPAIQVIQDQ